MSSSSSPQTSLVSILMPVKNAMPFLIDCVQSILDQDHVSWELLAVDDHSDDGSRKFLEKMSKEDSRIKVHKNFGKGIVAAIDTALSEATGTYITRMDADDIMHEEKLSSMIFHLGPNPIGKISVSLVKYFSENGISEGYEKYTAWLNDLTMHTLNYRDIYTECTIPSSAWMMHRETQEKHQLLTACEVPEDYDFAFRAYKKGIELIPVHRVLHYWRDHDKRTSRTNPDYDIRTFGPFKLKHFLKNEVNGNHDLVLWGGGKKGKEIASLLKEREVSFEWVTDNGKKQGKKIHGVEIKNPDKVSEYFRKKVIVAVSNPDDKKSIDSFLTMKGLLPGSQYYFFF